MTRAVIGVVIIASGGALLSTHILPTSRPNIASLVDSTQRDPLFALAGVNLERMDAAVEALSDAMRYFAAVQDSAEDKRLVASLYPISFLRHMSELESQRRTFLETKSESDANQYVAKLRETIRAYRKDLGRFEAAFTKTVPEHIPPYRLADGGVSRDSLLSAIRSLRTVSVEAEQEVDRRDACSRSEDAEACGNEKEWSSAALEAHHGNPLLSVADVASIHSALASTERNLNKQVNFRDDFPLINLSDAACIGEYPGPVAFGTSMMEEAGYSYPMPVVAGNRRLVDTSKHQHVPFFKFFADRGIRYISSSAMSHYQCAGYARDAGAFNTILDFIAAGMQTAIPGIATNRDAESFIEKQDNPELSIAWRNRSGSYEHLLFTVATVEQVNTKFSEEGVGIGVGAPFLFYARNAFGVVFMTANESVSRGAGSILSKTNERNSDAPHVYYRSLSPAEQVIADRGLEYFLSLHNFDQ